MAPLKNVTIVGASGNIGKPIAAALAEAGFNVTALTRESSSATFPSSYKVVKVADSYPFEELVKVLKGQDALLSMVTDHSIEERLVDAAIEAGVQRFVPSEYGCDTTDPAALELVPIFQSKVAVIDYLKAREGKIEWTAVCNGPFYDWGLAKGFLNIDFKANTVKLVDDGKVTFSTSTLAHIGQFTAAALAHPEKTANQYVFVESFNITQEQAIAAVEKATGKKLQVIPLAGDDLIKGSQEAIKNGNFMGNFGLIQACIFTPGKGGDHHDKAVKWMGELGIKPLDLQTETDTAIKQLLG